MSISLYKGAEARNCCYYLLLLNRQEWKNEGANEARPTQRRFANASDSILHHFDVIGIVLPARNSAQSSGAANRHHTMVLRWRLLQSHQYECNCRKCFAVPYRA